MSTLSSRFLLLVLLLIAAWVLAQSGYVFFAILLGFVGLFFFMLRIVTPQLPRPPAGSPISNTPKATKVHPPYPLAQEHISRHAYGFGAAMHNLGQFLYHLGLLLGGGKPKKPDDKKDKK